MTRFNRRGWTGRKKENKEKIVAQRQVKIIRGRDKRRTRKKN